MENEYLTNAYEDESVLLYGCGVNGGGCTSSFTCGWISYILKNRSRYITLIISHENIKSINFDNLIDLDKLQYTICS